MYKSRVLRVSLNIIFDINQTHLHIWNQFAGLNFLGYITARCSYASLWRPGLWRVSRCFLYFERKWVKVSDQFGNSILNAVKHKGLQFFFLYLCCSTTPLSVVFVSEGVVWLQSTAAFFLCFVSSEKFCDIMCNILTMWSRFQCSTKVLN